MIDSTSVFLTSTYWSLFNIRSGIKSHYKGFPKNTVVFNYLVTAMIYETKNMQYYQFVLDSNFITTANM